MDDFKVPELPAAAAIKVEAHKKESAIEIVAPSATTEPPKTSGCPYKVPKWSAPPPKDINYRFEVLKSGQIIDEVKELQVQPIWTFGRLRDNDVEMAHPTISRYHAVLQYKPKLDKNLDTEEEEDNKEEANKNNQPEGWYLYDLNSTHGTFLNKQRVPPNVYIRVRVGHMLKLGASTRSYILQGPAEDEEPESELTVTEIRAQREQKAAEAVAEAERKALEAEERERNEGVSWGMGEDADEETDLTHNPYASTNNEELYLDDPKKTLRGYFEREGLQLEYKCDEMSTGSFVCRVELPLDDSNGRPIITEVVHKGRKKDCVVQCALEACRILDRHGVLRQANQEPQKRKQQTKGNDSDDDEFWDRTGDVARKKQRMANSGASVTLTYDDLLKQSEELMSQLQQVESNIGEYQAKQQRLKDVEAQQQSASDDLDNFMDTLNEDVPQLDKTEIKKLRLEQQRLKAEQQKVQRLIKIAKPTAMPFVTATGSDVDKTDKVSINKKQLPMIGKRNQFSKFKVVKSDAAMHTKTVMSKSRAFGSDEEEMEEDEPEVVKKDIVSEEKTPKVNKVIVDKPQTTSDENQPVQETKSVEGDIIKTTEHDTTPEDETADGQDISKTKAETFTAISSESATVNDLSNADAQNEEAANRKRRQRARQRLSKQRQDLDELAEHEDSEKYAKWLPPANQTGDGMTELNQKYGY